MTSSKRRISTSSKSQATSKLTVRSIIDLAGEDEDSRIISYMNQSPVGDGGQWDMAVNLLGMSIADPARLVADQAEKYGVVPYKIFPDSYSSMASARLDQVLTSKLREYALQLRARPSEAKELKLKYISEVFNTVSIALGSPPMPTEHFVWEYYDKDNNCHQWEGTPKEYYHQFCKRKNMDPKDSFSLINDPRNKYEKLYTVERLGNAVGGRPVQCKSRAFVLPTTGSPTDVNVSTEALEDAVIAGIKAYTTLFIGCDAGKYSERNKGIWDTTDKHQFARSQPNKAQRLRTGESSMTHAMVITAVHLDQNGRPVRYKIENSWSDAVGEGAIMTADWFREFVYQVVVPRGITDKRWTEVLDDGNPTVLKPWDPIATPLQAMAGPSRLHEVVPLPFTIDLSCPSTLSHKPITPWPFEISGPSTRDEDASTFIRRRYLEILLLPDVSCPVPNLPRDQLTK
jgi:bleomycin hydrolase